MKGEKENLWQTLQMGRLYIYAAKVVLKPAGTTAGSAVREDRVLLSGSKEHRVSAGGIHR